MLIYIRNLIRVVKRKMGILRKGCLHNQFPNYCAFCDDLQNKERIAKANV